MVILRVTSILERQKEDKGMMCIIAHILYSNFNNIYIDSWFSCEDSNLQIGMTN
jgi:hypothetical protein